MSDITPQLIDATKDMSDNFNNSILKVFKDASDMVLKSTPTWNPWSWKLDDEPELIDPPDIFNQLDVLLDEMDEKQFIARCLLDDDLRITNIATWHKLYIEWFVIKRKVKRLIKIIDVPNLNSVIEPFPKCKVYKRTRDDAFTDAEVDEGAK